MNSTETPGRVVVGVDGSASSRRAVSWACREALRLQRPLHLLHTRDGSTPPDAAEQTLTEAVATARTLTRGVEVTSATAVGSAAAALVEASAAAHTLVVGARGRGAVMTAYLGTVSTQVTMHAHCPVVVVKDGTSDEEPGAGTGAGVVVGVDGSPGSQACLAFAFEQASSRGSGIRVVHAWPFERSKGSAAVVDAISPRHELEPQHRQIVQDAMAGWDEKYPDVEVGVSVVHARAADALLAHADGAHLLVVGGRGRGGFAGLLLGSVSQVVLQRADCPVAVVRGRR